MAAQEARLFTDVKVGENDRSGSVSADQVRNHPDFGVDPIWASAAPP